MYTRRAVKWRNLICDRQLKHTTRSTNRFNSFNRFSSHSIREEIYFLRRLSCHKSLCWYSHVRIYSSEGDGRNASERNHVPGKGAVHVHGGKDKKDKYRAGEVNCIEHSSMGVKDQEEWLVNEKLAIESRKKESPFLSRRERLKNELLRRVIPWEKISVTLETFPYYIHEHTKNLLLECASSHLKYRKFAATYGARLASSSGRILLRSVPGTELYRERLVKALARELKVPLLLVDSSILFHSDSQEGCSSEADSDEDTTISGEECTSDSEVDEEHDTSHEAEGGVSGDERSESSDDDDDDDDDDVDFRGTAEALKKLVPYEFEEFEKNVSSDYESCSSSSSKPEKVESSVPSKRLKKGDRVKYVGPSIHTEADSRPLSSGERGEVYEVNGYRAAVIFDGDGKSSGGQADDILSSQAGKPSLCWIHVKDLEQDLDNESEDNYVALKALCEVALSHEPLIVYFSDTAQLLSHAASKSDRKEFLQKVEQMFDQLSGSIVFICGQNKVPSGSKEKEKVTMILPSLGRLAKLPFSLKRLAEGFKDTKKSSDKGFYKFFNNVLCLFPPKEDDLLRMFNKHIEGDRRFLVARSNLNEMYKALEVHELSCMDILNVNTDGVILTAYKAEKVVGWARSHYLTSCDVPSVKDDRLQIPCRSLEIAILRLKDLEAISKKPSQNLKNIAKDEYETNFISSVVPSGEIGVKFDDIGALEDVKKTLNELVILPMRRPELFSHGNLLRPCKGILLFGPPGTGKTLLAKALATEAGANFINITGSSLTSKWFGDAEKLTKALFSFASKLAPVIVFVDEVDSLLGARGGAFEHEATRRMRNEFMAAWDGLRSKDSQRILILGATNRPFDLDDAVIRRLPRRIYVDLPDAKNRLKILKIFLAQENLENTFEFEKLANITEGYSGSDLKNLCIAAAYRPVQELLELEQKGGKVDAAPILRSLTVEDFVLAKTKVGPSVAFDAASMNELRKWNEQYGEDGSRRRSPFGFGD